MTEHYWQGNDENQSVINITPQQVATPEAGYLEYNYWIKQYCSPDKEGAMSTVNYGEFGDILMYNDETSTTGNFEYIFNLTNAELEAPDESSLFNIETLKTIVNLGQNTPNIIYNASETYGTDDPATQFNLAAWNDTAIKLGLNNSMDDAGYIVGQKRAYLIWLWMYTAKMKTFERDTSYQMGVIGKLGAHRMRDTMTQMSLELPMLTIAEQMYLSTAGKTCTDIYVTDLGVSDELADKLCT